MSKHSFKTEVAELLDIIVHSLYSHKEVFLRELLSNASDALDKLQYLVISDDQFKSLETDFRIDIEFDEKDKKTLTIRDSGIGMNDEDLKSNLGTIARSGTKRFLDKLDESGKQGTNLIGQFGVGFYSSFMVAEKVEIISRKAGEETAWSWISDGKTSYTIAESSRDSQGTTVILYLNDEGREYASRWSIESIVEKYSNHVQFPIHLHYHEAKPAATDAADATDSGDATESREEELQSKQINQGSALWKRKKSEITQDEYNAFYSNISGDSEEPLMHFHTQAEGSMEYVTLFYVPRKAPADLFHVDYRPGIKLYIQRVFITDDKRELMPSYLRFLRGIIDSEDLPLNVSREVLQENRIMVNIRNAAVKKVLSELQRCAIENKEAYTGFIEQYNKTLKEGLYADFENRDTLLKLIRYKSSLVNGYTGLADYKSRMSSDQKHIYYISGANEQRLKGSALVASYKKQGKEVLIMDDEIDDMVLPMIGKFDDLEFKAINRRDEGEENTEDAAEYAPLVEKMKEILKDKVQEVRFSSILQDAPCCVVWGEHDPNLRMQQIMQSLGQVSDNKPQPILELASAHPIIQQLNKKMDAEFFPDVVGLLYEQAMMNEGAEPADPLAFSQALIRLLEQVIS